MRSGNRFRAIALAAVAFFVVAACGGSSGGGTTLASTQELRLNIEQEPGTLDPGLQQWNYEGVVGIRTFEALLKPTKDLKDVTGFAADSYSIDSTGTVYTFKLHPGAKWSDGVPVKAGDFVYGYQRLLDPRVAASYASYYYVIKNAAKINGMSPTDPTVDAAVQTLGVKAVDDTTFQITLESPAGYFKWVASLWTGTPVRKDIVAKYGKDSTGVDKWGIVSQAAADSLVGNGQYKVSEVVKNDHITLVLNPNYAGSSPKPTITKMTMFEIADETVAYAKYKSGELDFVKVPVAETEAVKSSAELVKNPELTVFWIDINVTAKPFDNVKVRQAFAAAIDRDSFVQNVLKGRGLSAGTLIPKGMRNYRPDLGQKFDATAGKTLLSGAGVSASSLNGVKYVYNANSPLNKTMAEFVQAQIKTNLGVDVVLDGVDSKTLSTRLRHQQYQFGGPSGWGADYPDSQDWFDVMMTGAGNNFSAYASTTYDTSTTKGDAESDNTKRDSLYETAEKTLVADAPLIFLYQRTSWWQVKPYVKGFTITPIDYFLGDFYPSSIQIAQH
ncbi:MAG TPA: peptide ABC transporter substrate-binding protein [Candidatus Dormibacteraeota bacterium]|nr:peptide ABC transporter substrate-binding protein [Candidatus Dormibacteraeota bacterium]